MFLNRNWQFSHRNAKFWISRNIFKVWVD